VRFAIAPSLLSVILAATVLPAVAGTTPLAVGTKVDMRLVKALSSGTATVGQTFMAQAANSVVVGGATVISKGAAGNGVVVAASKAQGKSAGSLTIAFKRVRAVDGTWVFLHDSKDQLQGNAEKGKASTATIASTIILGPVGLFAHNMVKGKDLTLEPTQVFPAWVKSTVSVKVP